MRTNTHSIMLAVSATICLATVAGPAAARGPSGVSTIAPKAALSGGSIEKKICLQREPLTGSRIAIKECKTRAQWEADGFTVTTKSKAKAAR